MSRDDISTTSVSGGENAGAHGLTRQRDDHRRRAVILALVLLLTAFAFQGSLENELVDWDDEQNLVVNTAYRGLAWENIRWMFTTTHGGHYQPLSWLSFAVDYTIWGVSAFGFHLTNLLLHLVAVAGFYFVALEVLKAAKGSGSETNLTGQLDGHRQAGDVDSAGTSCFQRDAVLALSLGAGVAALLFAVHPLRVESVAWATERRDVLSGALLMPAVYFYLRGVRARSAARAGASPSSDASSHHGLAAPDRATQPQGQHNATHAKGKHSATRTNQDHGIRGQGSYRIFLAVSLLLYVLSLLAKASAMTLPLVLLLLDVYPLRRLRSWRTDGPGARTALRGIVFEKLYYAVPAVLIAGIAGAAQRASGAMWSLADHPLSLRVAQACYGVVFYLGKTVWPAGLVPLYQQPPDDNALRPIYLVCGLGVVAITVLVWRLRYRWPAAAVAWGVYLVLLLPVLGFAQSGPQLVADRYTYLACLPWAVLIGGCVAYLWRRSARRSDDRRSAYDGTQVAALCAVVVVSLVLVALTRAQVRVWQDSYTLWTTVIERKPDTGLAHANLAGILNRRGEFEAARDHARTALEILPGNRTAHLQLAFASTASGDLETAERHYRIGIDIATHLDQVDAASMTSLAFVLARMERWAEAEEWLRAVTEAQPGVAQWHYSLGMFLRNLNRDEEAGAAWERGLAMAPDDVNLLSELALLLADSEEPTLRDSRRAMELARRAVDYSNRLSVRAREALARAQAAQGDVTAAAETIRELLADERLNMSDETRARLSNDLAKLENRHAPDQSDDP